MRPAVAAGRVAAAAETVKLRMGGLTATVTGGPHLTISSLRHRGRELLHAPEALPAAYRVHGRRAGITLLHPWANRLSGDRVAVGGRTWQLPARDPAVGRDGNGLPIHGLAAAHGWSLEAAGRRVCQAILDEPPTPAFPFGQRVEVVLELLDGATLLVETIVLAQAPEGVPVAFGWHPYFRLERRATTELELPARRHLGLDPRGLPDGGWRCAEAQRLTLAQRRFDDGFSAIADGGAFAFRDAGLRVGVVHETGYPHAQVFAPLDADVLSLEPMSAPVDALRAGIDLPRAEPSRPYAARFSVQISG